MSAARRDRAALLRMWAGCYFLKCDAMRGRWAHVGGLRAYGYMVSQS